MIIYKKITLSVLVENYSKIRQNVLFQTIKENVNIKKFKKQN